MGAIKNNAYLEREITLSLQFRAVSHPARVKIMEQLMDHRLGCRNTDLAKWLHFAKPTVKNHIDMMKEAGMIEVEYFMHYYMIRLNAKGVDFAAKMLS